MGRIKHFGVAAIVGATLGISGPPASAAVSVTVESYAPGTLSGGLNTAAYKTATSEKLQDFPLDSGGSATARFAIGLRNGSFSSNTLIAVGAGGGITLKFQTPLTPLAGQDEFGVFTAQWLGTGGGFFNGNMEAAILVSEDNVSWRTLDGQVVADPLTYTAGGMPLNAPTVAYQFGATKNAWDYGGSTPVATLNTLAVAKFDTPIVDDAVFNGVGSTNAQRQALITDASTETYAGIYGTSGGGNWFDISDAGLAQVQYLRLNAAPASSAIRLDAVFANALAVPEPGTLALVALCGLYLLRRGRRS